MGAAHKFAWLNQWTPERMQAALDLYNQHLALYGNPKTANTLWCAAQYGIPESTFNNHVSNCPFTRKIKGCKHESGGTWQSEILSHGGFIFYSSEKN